MNLQLLLRKAEAIKKFSDMLGDMPNEIKQSLIMMEFYPHIVTMGSSDMQERKLLN